MASFCGSNLDALPRPQYTTGIPPLPARPHPSPRTCGVGEMDKKPGVLWRSLTHTAKHPRLSTVHASVGTQKKVTGQGWTQVTVAPMNLWGVCQSSGHAKSYTSVASKFLVKNITENIRSPEGRWSHKINLYFSVLANNKYSHKQIIWSTPAVIITQNSIRVWGEKFGINTKILSKPTQHTGGSTPHYTNSFSLFADKRSMLNIKNH